jgi:hypothetical protein
VAGTRTSPTDTAQAKGDPSSRSRTSAEWLEVVAGDVVADLASEVRALEVGVAEVEPDEHARGVDLLDDVVEAVVGACPRRLGQAGCAAIESDSDLVGAERCLG